MDFDDDHERPLAERLAQAEKNLLEVRKRDLDALDSAARDLALLEGLVQMDEAAPVAGLTVANVLEEVGRLVHVEGEPFDVFNKAFLLDVGVRKRDLDYVWEMTWSVGMVRRALTSMAAAGGITPEDLLAQAVKIHRDSLEECQAAVANNEKATALERKVLDLRRRVRTEEERKRQARLLPDEGTLEKVMRYEAHVSRQMLQTLHTLKRLQAARARNDAPPAALDITAPEPRPPLGDAVLFPSQCLRQHLALNQ